MAKRVAAVGVRIIWGQDRAAYRVRPPNGLFNGIVKPVVQASLGYLEGVLSSQHLLLHWCAAPSSRGQCSTAYGNGPKKPSLTRYKLWRWALHRSRGGSGRVRVPQRGLHRPLECLRSPLRAAGGEGDGTCSTFG